MEFWNFIRNMFRGNRSEEPRNLNPFEESGQIWQNNDIIDTTRHFREPDHFHIFTDPLQMTRFFESQMENMLLSFFYGFNGGNEADTRHPFNIFPFEPSQEGSIRDQFLKPSKDQLALKEDTDLDGKVTPDNFPNIWNEIESNQKPKLEITRPFMSGFCRSTTKEWVRNPDGTIEEKQIVRDSQGNEEIVVTRRSGDKTYTVITRKDKNGVETKIEDFCHGGEIEDKQKVSFDEPVSFPKIDLNFFPWDKFFKFDPTESK